MFHFDQCLRITAANLAIDARTRSSLAFVSHAHGDHMAPHEWAICTPSTAKLYRHRFGAHRRVREIEFGEWQILADHRLTPYPAGHMLGSAMLEVEYQGLSLLYTGDFRLGASSTAEPAQVPRADILVMESTFGDPRYRMPPRADVVAALIHTVRTILQAGRVPVIQAYVSGKCQEVVKLLWDHGIPAQQHPAMAAISGIYQECGIDLGPIVTYSGDALPGHVVMEPPPGQRRARRLPIPREAMTIAVTGWALDERARYRMGVDYAFPLTDHADYSELLQCIEMVRPRTVYCTHGPLGFARHLRELGHDAHPLNSARLAVSR